MENTNELLAKLHESRQTYYDNNKKNSFFKNKQKSKCAQHIMENMDLNTLLSNTIYIIPNTSNIYFDYTIFKLFANETIYNDLVIYTYNVIVECIQKYNCYTTHLNLKGLTITALDRYKHLIELFNQYCVFKSEYVNINVYLQQSYIYNSPSCINMLCSILKSLIEPLTYSKIVLLEPSQSEFQLKQLLEMA